MTALAIYIPRRPRFAFDRRISPRVAVLTFVVVGILLYAFWRRTVPAGPIARDVGADTMCFIDRIGLGGLCR
jgi:hypothetical protein